MKIEYWNRNSLSPELCNRGLAFIHRRFFDIWGIHRIDVTLSVIEKRDNVIMFDNYKIVGWLGVERDGELTNACTEYGYNGSAILLELIKTAYQKSNLDKMYAQVPVEKLDSAKIFLKSGMKIDKNPHLIKLIYAEREVVLSKLVIRKKEMYKDVLSKKEIERELEKLKEVTNVHRNNKIPKRNIQK